MTKLVVVCVFDSAIGSFARPVFVPSVGAAVRSFTDEVNRQADENPMYGHPDDFALYKVAIFDDESGKFSEDITSLVRGKDVKLR